MKAVKPLPFLGFGAFRAASTTASDMSTLVKIAMSTPSGGIANPCAFLQINIAKGNKSQTPLRFTRAPNAECRMYYMPEDIIVVQNTWERVARNIKNGGKGLCINGTWLKTLATDPVFDSGNASASTGAVPSATARTGQRLHLCVLQSMISFDDSRLRSSPF